MCKLCNTNNQSIDNATKTRTKPYLEVIKQYIGHYPCTICVKNLLTRLSHKKQSNIEFDIDHYVLNKLYKRSYLDLLTEQEKRQKESLRIGQSRSMKHVLPGIRQLTQHSTGRVSYYTRTRQKGVDIYIGTFPTLQEALENKINFLIRNNSTHGLKILQNKLKGLTNE